MKRQRSNFDTLSQFKVFDTNLAFIFLKNADVQEALKFAAAVGVDNRFRPLLKILKENDIWEYWFERDLKIFKSLVPWKKPKDVVIEAPEWKTYYLWMRLAVTCYQWVVVNGYEYVWYKAYPKDAKLQILRLNEIELSLPLQPPVILDFRKEFAKIVVHSQMYLKYRSENISLKYNRDNLWYLSGIDSTLDDDIQQFLKVRFPRMHESSRKFYFDEIREFKRMLSGISGSDGYIYSIVSKPPRMVEETTLLVASPIIPSTNCSFCLNQPARVFEATRQHIGYCSSKCQEQLYDWIESRRQNGPQDVIDENLNEIASSMDDSDERDAFVLGWEIQRLKHF